MVEVSAPSLPRRAAAEAIAYVLAHVLAQLTGAAAAIAIGGAVGLDALFGGPVTGASMNPARSFGPAVGDDRTSGA